MGRPKGSKNKSTLEKEKLENLKELEEKEIKLKPLESSTIDSNEDNQIILEKNKEENKPTNISKKDTNTCERCHGPILGGFITVNLTQLTGMAPYHLCNKNEKVKLCIPCAKKLLSLINSFLYNNGNGIEIKPWSVEPEKYKEKEDKQDEFIY